VVAHDPATVARLPPGILSHSPESTEILTAPIKELSDGSAPCVSRRHNKCTLFLKAYVRCRTIDYAPIFVAVLSIAYFVQNLSLQRVVEAMSLRGLPRSSRLSKKQFCDFCDDPWKTSDIPELIWFD
jgi:hypothetical protein